MNQYPIFAMAMNRLSDVKLACAVSSAGGIPSLSGYNYYTGPDTWDASWFRKDIETYKTITGKTDLLLSLGISELLDESIQQLIVDYNIKLIELIPDSPTELKTKDPSLTTTDIDNRNNNVRNILNQFRQTGTKVFVKVLAVKEVNDHNLKFDGVILKGPAGAGRFSHHTSSLEELFENFKTTYPDQLIVVSGGISTSKQVKYYIDNGAYAIGIGTLLAVSKESKMSTATKQTVVNGSSEKIKPLKAGAAQNALSFADTTDDSYNNTRGLAAGLADPTKGHIFVGKAIDNITEVRSVTDIIQDLVKDL